MLDRSSLHMDLHVSYDDFITAILPWNNIFLQLRGSFLINKSLILEVDFFLELYARKEGGNLLWEVPWCYYCIKTLQGCLLNVLIHIRDNIGAERSECRWVRSRKFFNFGLQGINNVYPIISSACEDSLFIEDNLAGNGLDFISTCLFDLVRAFWVLIVRSLNIMLWIISSNRFSWSKSSGSCICN